MEPNNRLGFNVANTLNLIGIIIIIIWCFVIRTHA